MLVYESWLHARGDSDFAIFTAVNSKSLHLPIGRARENWLPAALEAKDQEIRSIEAHWRDRVVSAAASIAAKYEPLAKKRP